MKKLIYGILLCCLGIIETKAYPISCRGNELMFYPYYVKDQRKNFLILTSNETNQIVFTLKPFQEPVVGLDYQEQTNRITEIDKEAQNKINFYIKTTREEEKKEIQMFYYINTQILIWESFYPGVLFEVPTDPDIEKWKQDLEAKYKQIPEWIKDTEFENKLLIPKESQYNISSDTCEINELESDLEITNCQENAELIITENIEDTIKISHHELSEILEGFAPRKWTIKVTQKETEPFDPSEEEKEDKDEKEEVEEDSKEENVEEENNEEEEEQKTDTEPIKPPISNPDDKLPEQENENPSSTWVIEDVPNTYDNRVEYLVYCFFLLFLWHKRK